MTVSEALTKLNDSQKALDDAIAKATADAATRDDAIKAYQTARDAVESNEGAKMKADMILATTSLADIDTKKTARANAATDFALILGNPGPIFS